MVDCLQTFVDIWGVNEVLCTLCEIDEIELTFLTCMCEKKKPVSE